MASNLEYELLVSGGLLGCPWKWVTIASKLVTTYARDEIKLLKGIMIHLLPKLLSTMDITSWATKKSLLLSIETWLPNKDPYFMVYELIPKELVSFSSPQKYPLQPG